MDEMWVEKIMGVYPKIKKSIEGKSLKEYRHSFVVSGITRSKNTQTQMGRGKKGVCVGVRIIPKWPQAWKGKQPLRMSDNPQESPSRRLW